MKKAITSTIDEALKTSDNLFKLIKDMKKTMMRQFLGIDDSTDITKEYESGFSSSPWKVVQLSELIKSDGIVQGPQDASFYDNLYSETGYPLILPGHIKSLRFMPGEFRFIEKDAALNSYIARGGDIIMLSSGEDAGASVLIPFMHENSMLGSRVMRIRPETDLCEIFYLLNVFHFFYNTGIMKPLKEKATGGFTIQAISEMPIPLPPLEKQKEIADSMLKLSGGMVAQESYTKEMREFRKLVENF